MPRARDEACRRDRLLAGLMHRGLQPFNITHLRVEDVVVDAQAGYLEAVPTLRGFPNGGGSVPVDPALRDAIEDYLNADHLGRPFLDWRPDIGPYLFPSHYTGGALSRRTVRKLRYVLLRFRLLPASMPRSVGGRPRLERPAPSPPMDAGDPNDEPAAAADADADDAAADDAADAVDADH